jgi:hypothetical protein
MRSLLKKMMIAAAIVIAVGSGPLFSQASPLMLPPAVEKDLAARASEVTEVTLNKNMLGFAAKFMNGKEKNDAAVRQLIEGLDGIYVRSYEFDKAGEYSLDQVDSLRKSFSTTEWSPMVREHERKSGETTDIMVKLINGEPHGMFILAAEAKELTIVLILGPIRMDQLAQLNGIAGLGDALGSMGATQNKGHGKDGDKGKSKDKTDKTDKGDKKGGGE